MYEILSKEFHITYSLFFDPDASRTHDLPLRRRLLYPTELQSLVE